MRPWWQSCARPAPSSSARPTCTNWRSAFPATTPRSRPAPNSASAMPMTRQRSRAALHRAMRLRLPRASFRRRSAPIPADRSASPAPSTAACRCGRRSADIRNPGIAPISHTRDTAGPMAGSMADVALLDRIIAGGGEIEAAGLKGVRLGVVAATMANLDDDTKAAFAAALEKLKAAGVTVVDVDMPKLTELNGQVGFPVALYEAYDDMIAYLKRGPKISIEELAKGIASPDVKGTYDGPRDSAQAAGPEQHRCRRQACLRGGDENRASGPAAALSRYVCQTTISTRSYFRRCRRSRSTPIPTPAACRILSCSSRTPIPAAMPASPEFKSRSRWALPANCRSAWNSTVRAGSDRRLLSIGLALEKLFGRIPPPAKL